MYQKIIIIGNLGQDPELRYTKDGTPVTSFSIATNESWTNDSGERQDRTTWWRVSAWRRLAETCNQYLSKGRQVMVEGRMNVDPETGGPRVWTRRDGSPGASYELTAQIVQFLGGRQDGDGGGFQPSDESVPPEANMEEDTIPF